MTGLVKMSAKLLVVLQNSRRMIRPQSFTCIVVLDLNVFGPCMEDGIESNSYTNLVVAKDGRKGYWQNPASSKRHSNQTASHIALQITEYSASM